MRISTLILFMLLSATAIGQPQVQYAQNKEFYVQKRKEIQDEIAETERQLEAIKKNKNATMSELRALQNKLAQRQNLIVNINDEIDDMDNTIKSSSKEVLTLTQQLNQYKLKYAQSIRYSYETRSSYDMIAFLFSSADFNDAMRRMKYLKKFRDFRKEQVEQIHATQNKLQNKIGVLKVQKAQKDELLNKQVEQKQQLQKETDETNKVMQELKGKESELMKNIELNRIKAKRVDKAINNLIEREMAKAAKQAEEEKRKEDEKHKAELAKNNPPANVPSKPGNVPANEPPVANAPRVAPRPKAPRGEAPDLLLTPTNIALANNFEGNKGKLYWPVDKGYITDHFGTHPHPVEHKVMVENAGVDIQTTPGATVKAVFEGNVSSVLNMDGIKIVMVQHGNYFTVYNNLSSTSVAPGQHVSTNQPIGVVANNDEGQPTIKFQIWKSGGKKASVKLNPEQWLGKAH
jgi:murein hydrolase activator